jgi:hypothetical protein
MKPFALLTCPVLSEIQKETIEYINSHTDIFTPGMFWNKINSKDFLKHNQTLVKFLLSLKMFPNEVALLRTDKNTPPPKVHIDESPLIAKINFPILNTSGTLTRWYDIPKTVIDKLPIIKSPFGADVPDFNDLPEYPIVGEYDMQSAIVFNSSMPHAVITTPESVFPRILVIIRGLSFIRNEAQLQSIPPLTCTTGPRG